MTRFLLFALPLLAFLWTSPVQLQAQEPEDNDVNFDFDPSKFKMGKKSGKRTNLEGYWAFGPTFITNNNEVAGEFYPEFKPFNSWSNDLGLMFRTRIGGANSPVNINYGLLWRYINVETDQAYLDWDKETEIPFYTEDSELDNSELNVHTLSVPIMLEFQRKVAIAAGGFVAFRVGSNAEEDRELDNGKQEITLRADLGLNNVLYGVTGQIGYKKFRVYVNYYLNNLFAEETPYDFTVMNVGVAFF
ncbi:MAG: hypothetical protein R2787_08105 [Saprospiraceae bacterium]